MNKFFEKNINHLCRHYVLWSSLAVILINLFDALNCFIGHGRLFYVDTDSYTRALRIVDWLQNFQWQEKIFPFFNAPDGFVLHFTRISDVIWLGLSLPFLAFEPLKDAIFHGGMLFSPLFFILSLATLFWGLQPHTPKFEKTPVAFALIFFTTLIFCSKLVNIFDYARPDQHSLMFFVFSFNLAVIMRALSNPRENHWISAGVISGLGIWSSSAVEGFIVVCAVMLVLCINWFRSAVDIKNILLYSTGLFCCTAVAWLINPPYEGRDYIDMSRLSIVHVVISALVLLSIYTLSRLKLTDGRMKFLWLVICSVFSILILTIIFGTNTLLAPVYTDDVRQYFLPYIDEMKPMYDKFYIYLSVISGLSILGYLLYQSRGKHTYIIDLTVFILIFLPLGITVDRFYHYYLALFLFLNALIIYLLMYVGLKYQTASVILFGYIIANLFYVTSFYSQPHPALLPDNINGVVATDLFNGPVICFEKQVKTVSGPYHTNSEGITDNHKIFFSTDENEVKQTLLKHGVEYIYMPLLSERSDYYVEPEQNTDKLYGKIMTGTDVYPWLERVSEDAEHNQVYKVRYDLF